MPSPRERGRYPVPNPHLAGPHVAHQSAARRRNATQPIQTVIALLMLATVPIPPWMVQLCREALESGEVSLDLDKGSDYD